MNLKLDPSLALIFFLSFFFYHPPLILIYPSQIKDHSYLRRLTQDRKCSLSYLLIINPKSGDSLCYSFLLERLPPPHPTSGSQLLNQGSNPGPQEWKPSPNNCTARVFPRKAFLSFKIFPQHLWQIAFKKKKLYWDIIVIQLTTHIKSVIW